MSKIADVLEPYTERYRSMVGDWHDQLTTMPIDEIQELFDEAHRLTEKNCGWWEFNAGQQLLDLIRGVVVLRSDAPYELRRATDWQRRMFPPRVVPAETEGP